MKSSEQDLKERHWSVELTLEFRSVHEFEEGVRNFV